MAGGAMKKELVDNKEVAADFEICTTTLDRWIAAGKFPAPLRFGRRKVWLRTSIETFVESKSEEVK